MHEGMLGIHEMKLMINATWGLGNGGSVGNHANHALDGSQIPTRNERVWLVVDLALESSGTPINKLDGALCLDGSCN